MPTLKPRCRKSPAFARPRTQSSIRCITASDLRTIHAAWRHAVGAASRNVARGDNDIGSFACANHCLEKIRTMRKISIGGSMTNQRGGKRMSAEQARALFPQQTGRLESAEQFGHLAVQLRWTLSFWPVHKTICKKVLTDPARFV